MFLKKIAHSSLPTTPNQLGIAHLGLIAVALVSIVVSTLLVQERTNFNPRADDWYNEEEFRGGDEESPAEPEQEPEQSEPEPEPEPEQEAQPEPEQEQPQPDPEPESESETEYPVYYGENEYPPGEDPAPEEPGESPIEGGPIPEEKIPISEGVPEEELIYEEEVVAETPEEGSFWEPIAEGVSEWWEEVTEGAGQIGEDLGVVDSEERIEEDVLAEAESEEIPDPVEVIEDESIPEEDRTEAIRILAESNGVDPNDPEAVAALLESLKTAEAPVEDLPLVETVPITMQLPFAREAVGPNGEALTPPSAEEFEAYAAEADRIVSQVMDPNDQFLDHAKQAIAFGLSVGMSEEEITSKLTENQAYFFDIMRSYIRQDGEGGYFLDLSTTERPTQANILWSIVSKNTGIGDYTAFTGKSEEEILDQLKSPYSRAMIYQAIVGREMDSHTAASRERLGRMVDYSLGNLRVPENTRDKYDHVISTVQEGRTMVLSDKLAAVAYYGSKLPENVDVKSTFAAFAVPGEGTIVITPEYRNNQSTHDHEWIHQSAYAANPQYFDQLVRQFGGSEEDYVLANMLQEGTTETAAVLASHLDSHDPAAIAYEETVNDIRGAMVAEIVNKGYSVDYAYATIAKAALTGDYSDFFKAIGHENTNKDGSPVTRRAFTPGEQSYFASKGVTRVKEILKSEYIEKSTKNKEHTYLFDFIDPKTVSAQENWSILNNDVQQIPAVSKWDQGFALGKAITESDKPRVSPLGTNSTSQVVVVNRTKNQKPVVVSSKLFELDSKVNITANMNTQYGELGEDYTKSILETSLLNPQIINLGNSYKLQTGRVGAVKGRINNKTYKVKIRPVIGYNLSLPETINPAKNSVLAIGVTPGKGRINYIKPKSSFNLNQVFTAFAAESSLTTAFYSDKNANGKWDRNEKALPWAGAVVDLIGQAAAPQGKSTFTVDEVPFFKIQLGPQQ